MPKPLTLQIEIDEQWMQHAIELAKRAESEGEVPVGAVLIHDNKIVGEGWNQVITQHDPSAHAEIQAIRAAAQALQNYRLPGTTLYVTLEPCTMCAGSIVQARVSRLVFGTHDPKTGIVESCARLLDADYHNHQIIYTSGVLQNKCSQQLKLFFKKRRELNKKNKARKNRLLSE